MFPKSTTLTHIHAKYQVYFNWLLWGVEPDSCNKMLSYNTRVVAYLHPSIPPQLLEIAVDGSDASSRHEGRHVQFCLYIYCKNLKSNGDDINVSFKSTIAAVEPLILHNNG